MQVHKEPAGFLLKSIRSTELKGTTLVKGVTLWPQKPFFYDSAYQHVKRDVSIPINEDDQCVVAEELPH